MYMFLSREEAQTAWIFTDNFIVDKAGEML